jgi:hypothetical protein
LAYQDDDYMREEGLDVGKSVRLAFACVLLICGILVGLWLVFLVSQMLTEPARMTESDESEPVTINGTWANETFSADIPAQATSFATRMFMLTIAASIAGSFIKGGVTLLSGSMRKLTTKFDALDQTVRKKMDTLADEIVFLNDKP